MARSKKLRVLHLISQQPDSTGSGFYIQAMVKEAAKYNFDNFLIAGVGSEQWQPVNWIEKNRQRFVYFNGIDLSYQIPGMSDVMPYKSTKFSSLSEMDIIEYEVAFTRVLINTVKEFKPDIIYSHHLWLLSSLIRELFPHIPLITSCHGTDLRQFQNCPQFRERVLKGCRKIDQIFALSEKQKNDIMQLYNFPAGKITLTGSGYNSDLFYPAPKPKPDPVQIIYAGKLCRAKGVIWLLSALKSITSPSWQLHLLGGGSGEEKNDCLKLAKELGGKVKVYGVRPQKEVAAIMKKAHILVLPSFFEGLPLVILEGLASGCRILVTDLPGVDELLRAAKVEFITLVKTPRLFQVDQPYPEDKDKFARDLRSALQHQLNLAVIKPKIDLSPIQETLDRFTWSSIFEKINTTIQCLLQ